MPVFTREVFTGPLPSNTRYNILGCKLYVNAEYFYSYFSVNLKSNMDM
jgi:hypothetical protein